MSQPELLKRLAKALDDAGVAYMITGSVAASAYGEPRLTHDIDVVVLIRHDQIGLIAAHFPSEQYGFDQIAAAEAIARLDQFQLFEFESGDKVDFWALSDEPFHQQAFERRKRLTITGVDTWTTSPEDLIVQKLSWAQWYESEKQFSDAVHVYELQYRRLDIPHIERWIGELGIVEVWQKLKTVAQPLT